MLHPLLPLMWLYVSQIRAMLKPGSPFLALFLDPDWEEAWSLKFPDPRRKPMTKARPLPVPMLPYLSGTLSQWTTLAQCSVAWCSLA